MPGIEPSDELIQLKRRFPDFKQQLAARTAGLSRRDAVGGRIVALVAPATAVEFARSNLQWLA